MPKIKRLRIEVDTVVRAGFFHGKKPIISFHELGPQNELLDIPDDIRFVFMAVDPVRPGSLYVYLESDEWPEIESYQSIRDIPIVIQSHYPDPENGEPLSKPQQEKTSKTQKPSPITTELGEEPKNS